jgi:hypothetical protein
VASARSPPATGPPEARSALYSVSSRLAGRSIEVRLYHDCLVGYLGRQEMFSLERLRAPNSGKRRRRRRCIDYRYVVVVLRLKPLALPTSPRTLTV